MSVHGVGPSMEFVAGPPSQSATTRTTPDSGLGGDERAMRVPPPGFNMSHPIYAPPIVPGPQEHYPNVPNDYNSYKLHQGGTTYFIDSANQPPIQQDYSRISLNRGQQNIPANYPEETYGNAQGDYNNPNGFVNVPPMPPASSKMNQPAPPLQQQSGYYWENHAMSTPRQSIPSSAMSNNVMAGGYDGEMASQQNQQYIPHNFHQPPPITPPSLYQQQPYMMQNGHPNTSPVMVHQVPVYFPHGYHPQMVQGHPGVYPSQVYAPPTAPLMLRQGGPRAQDHQYLHPAVVPPYYPVPPMMNTYGNPVMGFNPAHMANRRYNSNRRGNYMHSGGRYGRNTPGSVQSESRSESVRSEINAVTEVGEDIVDSLAEMQVKEPTMQRELSPASVSNDYKLKQKPRKELLQLASDAKPERTTPSPPTAAEPASDKAKPSVEQEAEPSEPEPPKKVERDSRITGCMHCKTRGKDESVWSSHNLKEQSKIVCEDAKKNMKCSICHNVGGENAHTAGSCPQKGGHRHTPNHRDRSTESFQERRGLMDSIVTFEKKPYRSRGGGNQQYRHYGPSNRDRDGGYNNRDGGYGGRGRFHSNRGQSQRGGQIHGKSDRGSHPHPVGTSTSH